jgi:hypothetical protein
LSKSERDRESIREEGRMGRIIKKQFSKEKSKTFAKTIRAKSD